MPVSDVVVNAYSGHYIAWLGLLCPVSLLYLHVRRTVPFTFTHFEGSLAPHTSSREYGNVCWTPARQKPIRQTKMF